MHAHEVSDVVTWVNFVANIVIAGGYLTVPFTVLRYLPLTRVVTLFGALFFLTCAITHLSMAFGVVLAWPMVLNHAVQAIAVVGFVLSFSLLLKAADERRRDK